MTDLGQGGISIVASRSSSLSLSEKLLRSLSLSLSLSGGRTFDKVVTSNNDWAGCLSGQQ